MSLKEEFESLYKIVLKLPDDVQQSILRNLLEDPLLSDISKDITALELDDAIMQEIGQTVTVYIVRYDGEKIAVTLAYNSTIRHLKALFQKNVNARESDIHPRRISWKYVWKNYCLTFRGMDLLDDQMTLSQIGVEEQSEIYFKEMAHKKQK